MVSNLLEPCFPEPLSTPGMIEAQKDQLGFQAMDLAMKSTSEDIINMLKNTAMLSNGFESPSAHLRWVVQLAWLITNYKFSTSPTMYFFGEYRSEQPFVGEGHGMNPNIGNEMIQVHIESQDTVQRLYGKIINKERVTSTDRSINEHHRKGQDEDKYNTTIMHFMGGDSKTAGILRGCMNYGQMGHDMLSNQRFEPKFPFPVSRLHIHYTDDGKITAKVGMRMDALEFPSADRLVHYLDKALSAICDMPSQPVSAIDLMTLYDYHSITELTHSIPSPKYELLHDMCLIHAKSTPDAPAVRSWDGDLTYQELERLVHLLAHWLVDQGVRPGIFVACVFYKSTWAIVARLAILMAGGAYVCVDAHDPPIYLASVLERAQVTILLSSIGFAKGFRDKVDVCFEVSAASIHTLACRLGKPCPSVTSSGPCVVLFTSGSTGTPKGIVQAHQSYASALMDYVRVMKMGSHSRVFQFDAYTFDISNNDFLAPLIAGGCCCVPTTSLSMEALMTDFMDLQANMMFVTPSVAIDIDPDRVPTLELMCIGGEPVSDAVLSKWLGRVRIVNQYGMGEVASMCAYNPNLKFGQGAVIGRPATGAIWIVNPNNIDQLTPIGAVGELLIEGPHVARGYLDQASGQSGNFLNISPRWLTHMHPDRCSNRLYRSGDLGRYHHDGNIELIGRKDSMLKLDGARIEAAQVEYILGRELSKADAAIVDVLGTIDGLGDPILVVFLFLANNPLNLRHGPVENMRFRPVMACHAIYPLTRSLVDAVQRNLPSHYIPSLFLLIDCVPRTKSKKTDRRKLHLLGQSYYVAHRKELGEVTIWPSWD